MKVEIEWKMFMDLLHDARWKTELISSNPLEIRIYHRFHGGDFQPKDEADENEI